MVCNETAKTCFTGFEADIVAAYRYCPLAEVHVYPLLLLPLSVSSSVSLWKLKGQWRLIRMQRRKALLQIENILILLMLPGRERQRERDSGRWEQRERKEG